MRRSENTEQKNNKKSKSFDALPLIVIFILVAIWQFIVSYGKIPKYILPSPIMVFKALYEESGLLFSHAVVTLFEAAIGFGLSIVLGGALGLAMGFFEPVRRALYPLFVIIQTIPLIVLAPLFAVWFGFGFMPKILIVVIVCFFPTAVTFTQDLIKPDNDLESLLIVMGAGKWKTFAVARIPKALPGLFSGLKIAATYSIMGAVISEWVGAQKGLGIFMTRAMTSFRTSVLFADVIVIVVLSLGLYKLVEYIEKRVLA